MNEWTVLGSLFKKIWQIFSTPMQLPWIGNTSPLKLAIFLSIMSYLVALVNGFLGGRDDGAE